MYNVKLNILALRMGNIHRNEVMQRDQLRGMIVYPCSDYYIAVFSKFIELVFIPDFYVR